VTSSKLENTPRKPRVTKPQNPKLAAMPVGLVAFMDPLDLGKLHVPASKRVGRRAIPDYSVADGVDAGVVDVDGVDTIKVLMATDFFIMFEAARSKGAIDTAHVHPDHHAVVYLKKGRVRLMVNNEWYTIEEGDSYYHPLGIIHQHEPLVDCIRVETKIYPNGGAIKAWNSLVGGSPASGLS
jgi:mannose-6-phosphate isomerase-like protein (cupin superfamily)